MGKGKNGSGKILEAWEAPAQAGAPIGCVATSFTFDPVFFEEECLSRFLKMQSDPQEDGASYLMEREEKLSNIKCASVLVDACHCQGKRSLRWDLLSARVPRGILHAKISLLQWTNRIRLIIASANLTEDGYRKNQEIFGVLDYFEGADSPLICLEETVSYLDGIVKYAGDENSPTSKKWRGFLVGVKEAAGRWGKIENELGRGEVLVYPVLIGPGRKSVFERFEEKWQERNPPIDAFITSPFFDPPGAPNQPTLKLWSTLRQRGEASATFIVKAEEIPGEKAIFIHAPEEILKAMPSTRPQAKTFLQRAKETDENNNLRPLHMKSLWFRGEQWLAHIIGSSNFTSPGLGLSEHPNLEANLLYLVSESANPDAAKALIAGSLDGEEIDEELLKKWQSVEEKGEDDPKETDLSLPVGFKSAIYKQTDQGAFIELSFGEKLPAGWRVYLSRKDNEIFYHEAAWKEQERPETVSLAWKKEQPASGFEVSWDQALGAAWWPVNVDKLSSLPAPEQLRNLSLDALIEILTSVRPLHQAMKNWLRRKDLAVKNEGPVIDPHKAVDTSGFLIQKTRRVAWALAGLRERLEKPVASEDALEWRINGPVGVRAVSRAIFREARSEEEKAFLFTELALELSRVKPKTALACLSIPRVKKELKKVIEELRAEVNKSIDHCSESMKNYIRSSSEEALK